MILKLFPGISGKTVNSILHIEGLKAVILETFGTGNAPTDQWLLESLKDTIDRGIIVINVTQCNGGSVIMGRYQTSVGLKKAGVISGHDITTESAVAKLMYLLGKELSMEEVIKSLQISLRGEMTLGRAE